ncbi:hypothetical protein GJAV_G00049850 [Gymnothorax javanicus]|nr:hypothetical protein GJAV_G00049850 [Gymnothorax javanicus]
MAARPSFVDRSSDVKLIDKGVKNVWRWEWVERSVEGELVGKHIRKIKAPGLALCELCMKEINYSGRGWRSLQQHLFKKVHKQKAKILATNYSLSDFAAHTAMEVAAAETGVGIRQPTLVSPSLPVPASAPPRTRERRKTPAFLSNLGKPTLRGVRKCPQCGVYTGTRGLSCKNKACGAVFRDGGAAGRGPKKGGGADVVRLVIDDRGGGDGGGTQVFSVRHRGRGLGAEQRGFVELALTDTAITTADCTVLTQVSLGRCFLSGCRQGRGSGGGGGAAEGKPRPLQQHPGNPCAHVKLAMECHAQATPLPLKSSVLESLQASPQAREELWRLATDSPGPLVQRVSQACLVVKSPVCEAHPLGLLHITVGGARGRGRQDEQQKYFLCACQAASSASQGAEPRGGKACLHFYACICAFASDDKLASEFSAFLSYDANGLQVNSECSALCFSPQPASNHSLPHRSKKLRLENPALASAPALALREGLSAPAVRKGAPRKHPISTAPKNSDVQLVQESHISLPFRQWLASVTERIHQTMHFQFSGKPDPLVFHIPHSFFNALQQRLSLGSKKRRLPNSTTGTVTHCPTPLQAPQPTAQLHYRHCNPLPNSTTGTATHCPTPLQLPLELTQSFVRTHDGSFTPFRCQEESSVEGHGTAERPLSIRPPELRTFLKVGPASPEQKEATPFVIEWIPDILPRSRVGELRIRFEYGHQHGGEQHGHQHGGNHRHQRESDHGHQHENEPDLGHQRGSAPERRQRRGGGPVHQQGGRAKYVHQRGGGASVEVIPQHSVEVVPVVVP